jgi:hypothetical protein
VFSIQNENRLTPSNEAQINIKEPYKLSNFHINANAHCITCYHDVWCSIKYYTLQWPCEFSTNQHNLPTTCSDSVNGVSQPRTRKQDTHYAITTQADVFTNTRKASYDLGTVHGWSLSFLNDKKSHRENASAGTFKDLQLDLRQGMGHIVGTLFGCQKIGAPYMVAGQN